MLKLTALNWHTGESKKSLLYVNPDHIQWMERTTREFSNALRKEESAGSEDGGVHECRARRLQLPRDGDSRGGRSHDPSARENALS